MSSEGSEFQSLGIELKQKLLFRSVLHSLCFSFQTGGPSSHRTQQSHICISLSYYCNEPHSAYELHYRNFSKILALLSAL